MASYSADYIRRLTDALDVFADVFERWMSTQDEVDLILSRGLLPTVGEKDGQDASEVQRLELDVAEAAGAAARAVAVTGASYQVAGVGVIDPIANWSLMSAPKAIFSPRDVRNTIATVRGRLATLLQDAEAGTGATGPAFAPSQLHPVIWTAAAAHWTTHQYRVAVREAAEALNQHWKEKLGRHDANDSNFWQQTLSAGEPLSGKPKLAWPGKGEHLTTKAMRGGLPPLATSLLKGLAEGLNLTVRDKPRDGEPGIYPFDKSEYPDFALVNLGARDMRYGVLYFADFATDSGDTGSDASAGRVEYSVQPVSWARGFGEKAYCYVGKGAAPASCGFSRGKVCYARRAPIAPPVHTGPVDWPAIVGTTNPTVWEAPTEPCDPDAIYDSNDVATTAAEAGFQRVRLDWNARAFLDLHVWDAQGRHGSVYLDRDGIPGGVFSEDAFDWEPDGPGASESFTQFGQRTPGPVTFGVCNHSGYATTASLRVWDLSGALTVYPVSIGQSGTGWTVRQPGGPLPPPIYQWCRVGLTTG